MADVDAALEQQVLTFRGDSGKRTCISATSRITSGDELKRRKGEGARDLRVVGLGYQRPVLPTTLV